MDYKKIIASLNRTWPRISGQITGFISSGVFGMLSALPDQSNIATFAISTSLFFMIMDQYIRKIIKYTSSEYNENKYWNYIVNEWLDNFYRFAIFIIVQYIIFFISGNIVGAENELFVQIISIFVLVLIILFLVVIFEDDEDKLHVKNREDEHNAVTNFLRAWNGLYGVFVQFYTFFFFNELTTLPNQTEVITATFVTVGFYLIFESIIREIVKSDWFSTPRRNPILIKYINSILDFGSVFFIFFIVEYIGLWIGSVQESNQLSVYGKLVIVFSVYIIVYSMFALITHFSEDVSNKFVWVETIGRIWPKIYGTTTGIFSKIIINYIFVPDQLNQIILSVLATFLLYAAFESYLREKLHDTKTVQIHPEWAAVLDELLDFPITLAPLLTINLFFTELIQNEPASIPNLINVLLISLVSQMMISTIFSLFKLIGDDMDIE